MPMDRSGRIEARGRTGKPKPDRMKPERPRDELGRPQPWGSPNRLDMPDFDQLSLEENHELGITLFEEGRYFPAHEAWETAWKQARKTDDAEFFKGLSQLGAGYVHLLRGNRHGAVTLLRRAASRVGRYPDGHRGIASETVTERASADARAVEEGELRVGDDAAVRGLALRVRS
jgi:predicted metal-dependent hydrolase